MSKPVLVSILIFGALVLSISLYLLETLSHPALESPAPGFVSDSISETELGHDTAPKAEDGSGPTQRQLVHYRKAKNALSVWLPPVLWDSCLPQNCHDMHLPGKERYIAVDTPLFQCFLTPKGAVHSVAVHEKGVEKQYAMSDKEIDGFLKRVAMHLLPSDRQFEPLARPEDGRASHFGFKEVVSVSGPPGTKATALGPTLSGQFRDRRFLLLSMRPLIEVAQPVVPSVELSDLEVAGALDNAMMGLLKERYDYERDRLLASIELRGKNLVYVDQGSKTGLGLEVHMTLEIFTEHNGRMGTLPMTEIALLDDLKGRL